MFIYVLKYKILFILKISALINFIKLFFTKFIEIKFNSNYKKSINL